MDSEPDRPSFIVYGFIDERNGYGNAGTFIAQSPTDERILPFCSGTLISRTAPKDPCCRISQGGLLLDLSWLVPPRRPLESRALEPFALRHHTVAELGVSLGTGPGQHDEPRLRSVRHPELGVEQLGRVSGPTPGSSSSQGRARGLRAQSLMHGPPLRPRETGSGVRWIGWPRWSTNAPGCDAGPFAIGHIWGPGGHRLGGGADHAAGPER